MSNSRFVIQLVQIKNKHKIFRKKISLTLPPDHGQLEHRDPIWYFGHLAQCLAPELEPGTLIALLPTIFLFRATQRCVTAPGRLKTKSPFKLSLAISSLFPQRMGRQRRKTRQALGSSCVPQAAPGQPRLAHLLSTHSVHTSPAIPVKPPPESGRCLLCWRSYIICGSSGALLNPLS